MRIEISSKHLELTPAIRDYAQTKCEKITKFYDGLQEIVVVISQPSARGESFDVEVRADVEKHSDFVAKVNASDLYEGIDLATDKLARQLAEFKERLKNGKGKR